MSNASTKTTEMEAALTEALGLKAGEYLGAREMVRFTEADGTIGRRSMCRVMSRDGSGWTRMVAV